MKTKFTAIAIILLVVFMSALSSSAEIVLIKATELQPGDTIIDKDGNEILVEKISAQEKQQLTISEYLKQKVYGNESVNYEYKKPEKNNIQKIISSGSITGNAVVSNSNSNIFSSLINKIKGWFGK